MAKDSAYYKTMLEKAKVDLQCALEEQEKLEERADQLKEEVVSLRRIVAGLSDYCGVPTEKWMGWTEACSQVMGTVTDDVSTADVLKAIGDIGMDVSHKSAAATVHTVLTRLAKKGEIERIADGTGVMWRGPKYDGIPF